MPHSRRLLLLAAALVLAAAFTLTARAEPPKNVILLIGDGMGFEQVKAAGLYAHGEAGTLAFEQYRVGRMTTHPLSLDGDEDEDEDEEEGTGATDSAAAGTAMATGHKTKNGIIGQTPDGQDLPTILEILARAGKRTGLVTTVPMTHATPASFGAHVPKRTQYAKIAEGYFNRSRPNLLFGAVYAKGKGVTEKKARDAGYAVLKTRDDLNRFLQEAAAAGADDDLHVSGQFAVGMLPWEYQGPLPDDPDKKRKHGGLTKATYEAAPHLTEMALAAIRLLEPDPDGFFLMIEGGAIDWACHDNCIQWCIGETLEFDKTCRAVLDWAKGRDDTLVIITADHECGGLTVVEGRGKGEVPEVTWSSRGHTGVAVPVYAWGRGAERLRGEIDNTALFPVMLGRPKAAAAEAVPAAQ
jgi:alkaline phosphatase